MSYSTTPTPPLGSDPSDSPDHTVPLSQNGELLKTEYTDEEMVTSPPFLPFAEDWLHSTNAVTSAQVAEVASGKDPLARTQMRVWVMTKDKVGTAGELKAFVPVANPLGAAAPMYWNAVAPLGGDEVMATCQRGADLFLVRGKIEMLK